MSKMFTLLASTLCMTIGNAQTLQVSNVEKSEAVFIVKKVYSI